MTREVLAAFAFEDDLAHVSRLQGGHIHRNLLVTCRRRRFVLQQLNDTVFPDIALLLSNVERVTAHLKTAGRTGPELVPTRDGSLSFRTADGFVWRAFHFLEGTVGGDTLSGSDTAYEAARCFADYLVALEDLPDPPLQPALAHFHDLPRRMSTLDAVVTADPVGRRSAVDDQIERAHRLGGEVIKALASQGGPSPVRIVHNDAKLSNVRFNATTGRATCVVDLDTTMPGYARHDAGELMRAVTSHAHEDAADEADVDFDLDLVDALAAGYFSSHIDFTPSEIDAMAVAGPEMAVENGLRFLTDHIAGDRYFAVDRRGQNLDRCRTQLRLTELMLDAQSEIRGCFGRAARYRASGPLARNPAKGAP
ncbi:MAG TPA: aminoglycoside phosphotransferase family protein [Acidimicrobiales bacterium]